MKYKPPDDTKSTKDCLFRNDANICCNAKNYLRSHKCGEYCVEKVDQWLRETYPELDEEEIVAIVTKLNQKRRSPSSAGEAFVV